MSKITGVLIAMTQMQFTDMQIMILNSDRNFLIVI